MSDLQAIIIKKEDINNCPATYFFESKTKTCIKLEKEIFKIQNRITNTHQSFYQISIFLNGTEYKKLVDDPIVGKSGFVTKYKSEKGVEIAIKRYFIENDSVNELSKSYYLNKIGYPNILIPSYPAVNHSLLLMEFKNPTINEILGSNDGLEHTKKKEIFNKIIDGLIELLDLGLLYTDLKPENVVYNKEDDKLYFIDIGGIFFMKNLEDLKKDFPPKFFDNKKVNEEIFALEHSFYVSSDTINMPIYSMLNNKSPNSFYHIYRIFLHQIVVFYVLLFHNNYSETYDNIMKMQENLKLLYPNRLDKKRLNKNNKFNEQFEQIKKTLNINLPENLKMFLFPQITKEDYLITNKTVEKMEKFVYNDADSEMLQLYLNSMKILNQNENTYQRLSSGGKKWHTISKKKKRKTRKSKRKYICEEKL